jgi:hypothetical protein
MAKGDSKMVGMFLFAQTQILRTILQQICISFRCLLNIIKFVRKFIIVRNFHNTLVSVSMLDLLPNWRTLD